MLDGKAQSDLEQGVAQMSELLPRIWRQIYLGCIREGFTPLQSIDLVKTYILSQNPTGIAPPSAGGATEPEKE